MAILVLVTTPNTIQKYWGMISYKHFYQLNKIIGSNKFYCRVGTIVYKYQGARKIIVI